MRALLVVNPIATSTTRRARKVLTGALASELKVDSFTTEYRGHAVQLARQAAADGLDLVIALGGDGTVNEVVNGVLAGGPGPGVPDVAVVPAGGTNVLARTLGLPDDPVEATGVVLEALRSGRRRTIGLGRANERYFTFCAGLGLDAEVVRRVEEQRARGRRATPGRYLRSTVRRFFGGTDRRRPALTLERPGCPPRSGLFLGIVTNTATWTYLGARPVMPCPATTFDTGLGLFAMDRLSLPVTLRHASQLLSAGRRPPHGRHLVTLHDETAFTLRADRAVALEIDGDYMGECDQVRFRLVPAALRVIA